MTKPNQREKRLQKIREIKEQHEMRPQAVGEHDALMLAAGKQFLEHQTGNVFKTGEDNVIVIADMRDELGAIWAAAEMGAKTPEQVREFRDMILNTPDGENPHPFVAWWAPRSTGVLDFMRDSLGFGVPADWPIMLSEPPAPGAFYTILKRNGRGLLMAVDYDTIPSIGAPALVKVGDEPEKGMPDN